MTTESHPFPPEEVMAYLDGEVAGERALALAEHLESCKECSTVAEHFCAVSQQLLAWAVESSPLAEPAAVEEVLVNASDVSDETRSNAGFGRDLVGVAEHKRFKFSRMFAGFTFLPLRRRLWTWGFCGGFALLLVLTSSLSYRGGRKSAEADIDRLFNNSELKAEMNSQNSDTSLLPRPGRDPIGLSTTPTPKTNHTVDAAKTDHFSPKLGPAPSAGLNMSARSNPVTVDGADAADNSINGIRSTAAPDWTAERSTTEAEIQAAPLNGRTYIDLSQTLRGSGPLMIAKTTSLTLTVKEIDVARVALEGLAKKHDGYFAQLTTEGQSQGGHSLSASLRVPAGQLDATVADLQGLGELIQEKQSGEEVSPQHLDLEARLTNARQTEKRLTELLAKRTNRLKDVLDVERELADTREEIERMEAQKRILETQVEYAAIELCLREQYKPMMNLAPPATGARLRNAFVDGYRGATESGLTTLVFLLRAGPAIVMWAPLVMIPAWWLRRRFRAAEPPPLTVAV